MKKEEILERRKRKEKGEMRDGGGKRKERGEARDFFNKTYGEARDVDREERGKRKGKRWREERERKEERQEMEGGKRRMRRGKSCRGGRDMKVERREIIGSGKRKELPLYRGARFLIYKNISPIVQLFTKFFFLSHSGKVFQSIFSMCPLEMNLLYSIYGEVFQIS